MRGRGRDADASKTGIQRRSLTSNTQTRADRYEGKVHDGFADEGKRLLAGMPPR
jgi:hypothetical protein